MSTAIFRIKSLERLLNKMQKVKDKALYTNLNVTYWIAYTNLRTNLTRNKVPEAHIIATLDYYKQRYFEVRK